MYSALEKHLRAAQKYLTGIKTLPTFEGVRNQQLQEIKVSLEKVSLTVDQAACLVGLLGATVWGSSLDELKAAVTPRVGLAVDNLRKQQQDYTLFLHYITPSMWKAMENLHGQKVLEKLCQHAALLGLRNPTEQSVATLLTLSFDTHGLLLESDTHTSALRARLDTHTSALRARLDTHTSALRARSPFTREGVSQARAFRCFAPTDPCFVSSAG